VDVALPWKSEQQGNGAPGLLIHQLFLSLFSMPLIGPQELVDSDGHCRALVLLHIKGLGHMHITFLNVPKPLLHISIRAAGGGG
jgi:hypothetical protein